MSVSSWLQHVADVQLNQRMMCVWRTKPIDEADGDRADADEHPRPQLVEMLDERGLFAMVEATRQPDPRHPTLRPAELGDGLLLLLGAAAGAEASVGAGAWSEPEQRLGGTGSATGAA